MSLENVIRFYETIVKDKPLRDRIIEANRSYDGRPLDIIKLEQLMAEEFLPLLKEEGFEFTIDELHKYQDEFILRKPEKFPDYKISCLHENFNRKAVM